MKGSGSMKHEQTGAIGTGENILQDSVSEISWYLV